MNNDNNIRQQFQSKLGNFEAPLPDDGWSRLEQSLNAALAARVIRRRWYIGSAAAVLILLVGSLLFLQNPIDESKPFISEAGLPKSDAQKVEVLESNVEQSQDILFAQQETETEKTVSRGTVKTTVANTGESKTSLLSFLEKLAGTTAYKHKKADEEKIQQFDEAEKQRLIEDFILAGERSEILLASARPTNDERKMMLSFGGRGGLTSFQKTVNSPMMLRSASVAAEEPDVLLDRSPMALAVSNTANNIAEMEHSQPVSFGLMVSKSIFDNLSVETGLVYTYLYSKARNINIASKIQETQQFHYIGIPLNINYNIVSFRNLDVYATLGGMAEKDVAGKRQYMAETVTELNGVGEERLTEKIEQNNIQYSVNAGVGVSYPIYENLNLYGKVSGSYYFDAKNPYNTIYSNKKIMLDLNLGLRYEF